MSRAPILPWWAWIVLVNALFTYSTRPWFDWVEPVWPRAYAVLDHVRPWLDLGVENNLGVWWSGALLFLGSLVFLELAAAGRETRGPFVVLGLLSLALCVDEVASVHERLSDPWGWAPLVPIGLMAVVSLGWALLVLTGRLQRRATAGLVLGGYLLYGSAVLQEFAEQRESASWIWQAFRSGPLEEGAEVFGSLLILLAAVWERHHGLETRLRAMIPHPDRLPGLRALLTGGLVLHALLAVFVVPWLPDWEWRGNPTTWYPAAAHGLAACAAFWRARGGEAPRWHSRLWTTASIVFLLASIGAIFDEVPLLYGIERFVPRGVYYGFYASYVFLVPPLVLLAFGGLVRRPALLMLAVALPLASYWLSHGSWRVGIVTPGILAWAFALAFGVGRGSELAFLAREFLARRWLTVRT